MKRTGHDRRGDPLDEGPLAHPLRLLRRVATRLARPARTGPPVWDRRMAAIAIAGLLIVLCAGLADGWAIRLTRASRWPLLHGLRLVTDIALVQWYLLPALLVLVTLFWMDWRGRTARARARLALLFGQALYAFGAIALAQLLTRILKLLFGRARPELMDASGPFQFAFWRTGDLYWSFPSGHATTAGALSVVLMLWFPSARVLFLSLGLVLAISRVAADAHYPSDVAAGYLVGFLFALSLARALARRGLVFRFKGERLLPLMRFVRRTHV